MNIFSSTSAIIKEAEYFNTPESFFNNFEVAFERVRSQILKIETRQEYIESGNISYEAMATGDLETAIHLINEARIEDKPLYDDLNLRGVDFLRCRPIKYPLSPYIKWELKVYEFNSHCERIFCCNYDAVKELMEENIKHDFMVFDSFIAFIHNYNTKGEIEGGWTTQDITHIVELQKMFIFMKSLSNPYTFYI